MIVFESCVVQASKRETEVDLWRYKKEIVSNITPSDHWTFGIYSCNVVICLVRQLWDVLYTTCDLMINAPALATIQLNTTTGIQSAI